MVPKLRPVYSGTGSPSHSYRLRCARVRFRRVAHGRGNWKSLGWLCYLGRGGELRKGAWSGGLGLDFGGIDILMRRLGVAMALRGQLLESSCLLGHGKTVSHEIDGFCPMSRDIYSMLLVCPAASDVRGTCRAISPHLSIRVLRVTEEEQSRVSMCWYRLGTDIYKVFPTIILYYIQIIYSSSQIIVPFNPSLGCRIRGPCRAARIVRRLFRRCTNTLNRSILIRVF